MNDYILLIVFITILILSLLKIFKPSIDIIRTDSKTYSILLWYNTFNKGSINRKYIIVYKSDK